ncbi:MAG: ImpA family type secretion-associated protein, partial [Rhodoferax sp.]|nr:ImpA family type secretion-associated protein [Rhodoferax sp.]
LSLHESSHASWQAGYSCHTEFQVQPANKTFRSPQTVEKPFTAGPQTAIVTGPAGEEIYCDAYGRIKVSFHWNRYCTKDENSSCWIRVVTPWAASNFGMVAIPRIGTEVAIAFEGGDPDRPIVMGQVYNALNMPPWELPGNMTQSGIKTRSTLDGAPGAGLKAGGGDANALRFEDKKGQEQLWVHAQKDFLSETENDENKWVGRDRVKTIDRDETNHIKCDRTETVHRNEDITVHNDRTERVDHNEKVSIGDNQDLSVGINRSKSVGHNETDDIGTKWSIDVGKVKTENIGIADMLTVGLARMMSVGGVYSQNIGMLMNTVVGVIQSAQIGMTKTTTVGTNYKLTVGGGGGGDAGAGAGAPMNVVAESPAEGGDAAGGGGAGAILEMDAEKISLTIGKATFILNFDGTLTAKGVDFKFLASGDILVKAGGNIKFQANQIDEN